jgi:hypothetical protein
MKKHKKSISIVISLLAFALTIRHTYLNKSINTSTKEKDIRKVVWEQLFREERYEVTGRWKKATVEKIILSRDLIGFSVEGKNHYGREVYLITFQSENKMLGNIARLVDIKSKKVIGYGGRD